MDTHPDSLTIRTPVRVPVGDGHIFRFGLIASIDGENVEVDLGSDGTVAATRDTVRRL
ncbi:hypothetical protein I6A60_35960 [Frankia sp. AgB1.9]|uniref:hypothetical protein n=1 Tax=unclassified Frankia TaxID=2632575 RepID=UPI001932DB29|nr:MULTISPECIES: hypothetical protein [unclassified Frankia]MBL7487785.1 hypothetical protein [Frankia sp. AgW1.1]MBL7553210.1 hypothetical protein [Frankia sp. AgB1.9]MBL7622945.1 hypothetical protein [Frankia sp. AgB1.8]